MSYTEQEREKILSKGLEIYKNDPARLNCYNLAKELNMSNGKIHYHFGDDLKEAIYRYAIEKDDSHAIVSLLLSKHHLVSKMPKKERLRHVRAILL